MKTWLKGGLIGGIILGGLQLLAVLYTLIMTRGHIFSANFLNFLSLPGSNELLSLFLISTLLSLIILFVLGFLIGALIGWIISKLKN